MGEMGGEGPTRESKGIGGSKGGDTIFGTNRAQGLYLLERGITQLGTTPDLNGTIRGGCDHIRQLIFFLGMDTLIGNGLKTFQTHLVCFQGTNTFTLIRSKHTDCTCFPTNRNIFTLEFLHQSPAHHRLPLLLQ